ncbi:GMC family oxidoreductase [Paracoccus sp. Z118]|uniref:GMC family oxidoreductase n=1 Tax=Paracoccus sp. Z118 TaxID=2851017 RepID=UPI001C2CB76A|nr:GMC family oxidoreductase [Paracoccus sp. Z118]MBV0892927.1 GMC family oxidoreductase [Paracoccus sp. Z118]
MARQEAKKDVVIVGLGWTGAVMGMELAQEGLEVVALERGHDQDTVPDWKYPDMIDELKYGVRLELIQRPALQTLTIRRNAADTALPFRSFGSFLPGNGVGGAGTHWNALNWRPQPEEMRLRSHVLENWGEDIIPDDMLLGDYPVTYDEMEPYFDKFEYVAGISGQAGNIRGQIIEGGNPFEGWRSRDYPMPPMPITWDAKKFADAASAMGYHPFKSPGGIASTSYINPYGMQMGPCTLCGFCERYGCFQYSKSSPQTMILDALKRMPNFSYRVNSEVLRVEKAPDGQTATGVTYWDDAAQEEVFQPADIVILAAYSLNNVHLMLLSGIGQPYDPVTGEGVTGKSYGYQMNGSVTLFFQNEEFNPFIGTGANGMSIDDFGMNQIDYGREGFIGGAYWRAGQTNGQPTRSMPLPRGTASWGGEWKQAIGQWYGHAMTIGTHGSNMSYRTNHLDLDPTYTDRHGRPLMRMTFNWNPNDIRMTRFQLARAEEVAASMNPDAMQSSFKDEGAQYDIRPYQTTHNTGGHIMSENPQEGVVNRYSQVWGMHNVFATGAGNFVQNTQYNPTGFLGGLAYWTADAIRTQYLSNPRPLV